MIDRPDWARRIHEFTGRPARWATEGTLWGDYDGRENTLEVFNVDAKEQRALYRQMRPMREALEQEVGAPLIVLFHTRKESLRLYADFVFAALLESAPLEERENLPVDTSVRPREGGDNGSRSLPRVAA